MRRDQPGIRRRPWGLALLPLALAGCGYAAIGAWLLAPDSSSHDHPPVNAVPFVNVSTPVGRQQGDVAIQYFCTDAEGDPADLAVAVQWSTDGTTFGAATQATEAGTGSDGTTGLTAAPTGTAHTFVWDSLADAGIANGWAIVTLTPIQPGSGLAGEPRATGAIEIHNDNLVPTVAVGTPSGNQSNTVPVTLTLADAEGDAADVAVEFRFSTDGGTSWTPFAPASEVPGAPSEGSTGLGASAGGTAHTWVWNAFADVGGINALAQLRVTPSDPGPPLRSGTAVSSGSFNVLNQLIGTVLGGAVSVLSSPADVALDANGNCYIADKLNHRVQLLNTQSTTITVAGVTVAPGGLGVLAGVGTAGYNGDNQLAVNAQLNFPRDVDVDGNGHVYVADTLNHRIRRIDAVTGFITTVAGTGTAGRSGDNQLAINAQLNHPSGIDFDASGNLVIADTGNHWVRVVNNTSTNITIAGTTIAPNAIRRIAGSGLGLSGGTGDGGGASLALLDGPWDVAVAGAAIHVADSNNHCIRTVNAGTGSLVIGSVTIAGGNIDTTAGTNGTLGGTGDGGSAVAATLHTPRGVAVAPSGGHLYIADTFNSRLRVVNVGAAGSITLAGVTILAGRIGTIAGGGIVQIGGGQAGGDGGAATSATLTLPEGVAVLSGGHPVIADTADNRVRGVNVGVGSISIGSVTIAAGAIETVAGSVAAGLRVVSPAGLERSGPLLFVADQDGQKIVQLGLKSGLLTLVAGSGAKGYGGDGAQATKALLDGPTDVTLDGAGNVIIADFNNGRVRAVNTGAAAVTLVGVAIAPGDIDTLAGGGAATGDGGAATSAGLKAPAAVLIDGAGDLIFSEYGNEKLRIVNSSNTINTLAGSGTTGFADGALASAQFHSPGGLWLDGSGNVLVADSQNHAIRYVNRGGSAVTIVGVTVPAGQVGTIVGIPPGSGPLPGFNGDNQAGTLTRLWRPTGVAVLPGGDVVLVDANNERIRRVNATTGLVSTICGTGSPGFNGDGIPPVNAQINGPAALTVDKQTPPNLFFSDAGNKRVRRFTP